MPALPGTRRRLLGLAPALLAAETLLAQSTDPFKPPTPPKKDEDESDRLPDGRHRSELVLKADFEQDKKDAHELAESARAFEEELNKSDRYVLSLALLKKLDDIERLARRIRTRMKRT